MRRGGANEMQGGGILGANPVFYKEEDIRSLEQRSRFPGHVGNDTCIWGQRYACMSIQTSLERSTWKYEICERVQRYMRQKIYVTNLMTHRQMKSCRVL